MGQPSDGDGAVKASPDCPVCGQALDEGTRVDCTSCGTPHHRDCWGFRRGCSSPGCGGVTYVTPPSSSPPSSSCSPPSLSVSRPLVADPRAVRRLAFVMVALFLVTLGLFRVARAAAALPVFLLMLLADGIRHVRVVHEVDPASRSLRRSFFYARHQLTRGDTPLAHLDDVVEIHRHDFKDGRGSRVQQVWLALDTGERILVAHHRGYGAASGGELPPQELAERLSGLTDTTVRLVEAATGPTVAEIRAVANERVVPGEREEEEKREEPTR